MGDSFALSALTRKRAELAGRVEAAYAELEWTLADLAGLDTAIRLFDLGAELAVRPLAVREPDLWGARAHVFGRRVLDLPRRGRRAGGDSVADVAAARRPGPRPGRPEGVDAGQQGAAAAADRALDPG